jgi:hypothetical protein
MKVGERYYIFEEYGELIDDCIGATLCPYCQYYFNGDGEQDICNNCIKRKVKQ